jgi:CMP/dCMP kinase
MAYNMTSMTITIDGPAASGKSTIGKILADELGYLFFDTGVMYRAITWIAVQRDIPIQDEAAITTLAEETRIDVRPPSQTDGRQCDILVDGIDSNQPQDITWQIRQPEVDANVSPVSAYPGVRRALTIQQRRIGQRGGVVMVGRDIGTVVLPEANLKIYLIASAEERARRRYEEKVQRGEPADLVDILAGVHQRDQIDSTRQASPLRPATDAVILDSDELTIQEVFARVMSLIQEKRQGMEISKS